jgi:protein-tyrosine phosphatase
MQPAAGRAGDAPAWIDLHTHILPAMDDGASDLDEALEMARIAQNGGIAWVVATPHNMDWPAGDHRPIVDEAVQALNQAIRRAGLRVTVLPGVEAYVVPDMTQQVKTGRAFPLGSGNYVLLELPASAYPLYTDQAIFELQVMGLSVILAHPERNAQIMETPERLIPLIERGVLVQVTAASILGEFGRDVQRTTQALLRGRLAHVIASDAHGGRFRRPELAAAVEAAGALVGPEAALAMVTTVPQAILTGDAVEAEAPRPARAGRKGFWSRLFSGR